MRIDGLIEARCALDFAREMTDEFHKYLCEVSDAFLLGVCDDLGLEGIRYRIHMPSELGGDCVRFDVSVVGCVGGGLSASGLLFVDDGFELGRSKLREIVRDIVEALLARRAEVSGG